MNLQRATVVLAIAAAVGGCSSNRARRYDPCDARLAAFAVGSAYSSELADRARRASRASYLRISDGEIITSEFQARRLDVTVADGVVTGVFCR